MSYHCFWNNCNKTNKNSTSKPILQTKQTFSDNNNVFTKGNKSTKTIKKKTNKK